ncbi:hypothetical protein D9757_003345 [Collybiopsis confluens]|uniref:Uncharacterized protein n=1 Tax=Collybiopsis confluens TaxID=2823264 RepID=A0A8H5MFP0_9AGAR|nr:hypothetical protein D9757_003345 [Collybiopsis confluens]
MAPTLAKRFSDSPSITNDVPLFGLRTHLAEVRDANGNSSDLLPVMPQTRKPYISVVHGLGKLRKRAVTEEQRQFSAQVYILVGTEAISTTFQQYFGALLRLKSPCMFLATFLLGTFFILDKVQCQKPITLLNITVDDQLGDPHTHSQILYSPPEAWSSAPACDQCPPHNSSLLSSEAYGQTWHQSVTNQMLFTVDGTELGSYSDSAPVQVGWRYNTMVYRNNSMPMAEHELTIQTGQEGGPDAIILLDSILYTTAIAFGNNDAASESQSPVQSKKKIPVTTIVVGAALGFLGGVLICGLIFLLYRRRYMQPNLLPPHVNPSVSPAKQKRKLMAFLRPSPSKTVQRSTSRPSNTVRLDGQETRVQSILEWRQNTHQESRSPVLAPADMSEVLSSYYESTTVTGSRRIRTPPPPPRRYIIRNV